MEIRYVPEGWYCLVKYRGVRTLPTIVAMLEEVKEHADRTGIYRYIFDLNDSEEGFTLLDKYKLGEHLVDLFGNKFTVAVFMKREQITGFLETVYMNRSASSRFVIMDDEAKAIEWMATRKSFQIPLSR